MILLLSKSTSIMALDSSKRTIEAGRVLTESTLSSRRSKRPTSKRSWSAKPEKARSPRRLKTTRKTTPVCLFRSESEVSLLGSSLTAYVKTKWSS